MSQVDFGVRNATAIRQPATANLMIDSGDRYEYNELYPNPFNFQIQKTQALLNGYFTRIGVSEVVMEWCEPNIASVNNFVAVDLSGGGSAQLDISGGFYTSAGLLSTVVSVCNNHYGPNTFSIEGQSGTPIFLKATDVFHFDATRPTTALGISLFDDSGNPIFQNQVPVTCPDLRPYRYIDIICNNLTSVQRVKDSSTAPAPNDVLTRWYFTEDSQETYDELGFPILQGYKPFCRRRIFNPPKQIRWEQNLPVGNLRFEAWGRGTTSNQSGFPYTPVETGSDTNWDMTLQLSEN